MRALSLFFIVCFFIMSTAAMAEELTATNQAPNKGPGGFLLFQVIQDQFVFDNTTIKSASLVMNGETYVGLKVVLKPLAAKEFEKITTIGVGKPATLVFDKSVISTTLIQSPIGGTVLVSGLTKEQAQMLLMTLTQIEKRHVAEKRIAHMPNY